jgi:hypothetical protein
LNRRTAAGARSRASAFLILLAPVCAFAQSGAPSSEALARCASLPDDAARLACFDRLTGDLPAGAPTAPEAPGPSGSAVPAPDTMLPSEPPGSAVSAPPERSTAPRAPVREPTSRTATAEPDAPRRDSEDPTDEDLGERYLRDPPAEPDGPEVIVRRVERVEAQRGRPLLFHFADGQVWRQMTAERFLYPRRRAFDAHITQGIMGDYQLRVEGEGRMTRIVRVR